MTCTNPSCSKMYKLLRFGVLTLNHAGCAVIPVLLCGSWLYLSVASDNAHVQYSHDIFVVCSVARTAFIIAPLNISAILFSSELCGTVGTCVMSMSSSTLTTIYDIYSLALSEISQSGCLPKVVFILFKNDSMIPCVSALLRIGCTFAYLLLSSINEMKYHLNSAGMPGIFSGPIM